MGRLCRDPRRRGRARDACGAGGTAAPAVAHELVRTLANKPRGKAVGGGRDSPIYLRLRAAGTWKDRYINVCTRRTCSITAVFDVDGAAGERQSVTEVNLSAVLRLLNVTIAPDICILIDTASREEYMYQVHPTMFQCKQH